MEQNTDKDKNVRFMVEVSIDSIYDLETWDKEGWKNTGRLNYLRYWDKPIFDVMKESTAGICKVGYGCKNQLNYIGPEDASYESQLFREEMQFLFKGKSGGRVLLTTEFQENRESHILLAGELPAKDFEKFCESFKEKTKRTLAFEKDEKHDIVFSKVSSRVHTVYDDLFGTKLSSEADKEIFSSVVLDENSNTMKGFYLCSDLKKVLHTNDLDQASIWIGNTSKEESTKLETDKLPYNQRQLLAKVEEEYRNKEIRSKDGYIKAFIPKGINVQKEFTGFLSQAERDGVYGRPKAKGSLKPNHNKPLYNSLSNDFEK